MQSKTDSVMWYNKVMKIVILGKNGMLLNLIRGALLADVEICGVLRYERTVFSRIRMFFHDFLRSSPELTLIKKHKIRDLKFTSANSEEFKNFLIKENVDIVLVGTWREKLSKEVINLPVIGTINVHPSLLPQYRGPNPYLQTILHGEKFSGVTFHLMNERFDAGSILAQEKVEILEGDTGKELKNKIIFKARLICAELLNKLGEGFVIPVEQDESRASYYENVKPEDMTLNFEKETSEELLRRIRAFHPFLPTYFQYKNVFFKVNPYEAEIVEKIGSAGEIIEKSQNSITVAAKDGKALRLSGLRLYRFPLLTNFYIRYLVSCK